MGPIFAPRPLDDFDEFMAVYFDACRARCPQLRVIGGKWAREDLIPGMSDFDTRFIAAAGTRAREWAEISVGVGAVHAQLARSHPRWARILEHLPGINLAADEVVDPRAYYPEFPQWTFYSGDRAVIEATESALAARPWGVEDEAFHLKKLAAYFGPYQRGIDPPINMGRFESKYPLHSRYMHYFAPAVQAGVSLAQRRACRGKLEALRLARNLFPRPEVIDQIFDAVDRHYEVPADYAEPRLTRIERDLEAYLAAMYASLGGRGRVTLIEVDPADDVARLKAKTAKIAVDPRVTFFDSVRFVRLMQGRLQFYAQVIPGFDSAWLVRNELGRMGGMFFETPLRLYGQLRFGEKLAPAEVLGRLRGNVLSVADADGFARFGREALTPIAPGQERQRAAAVAATYEPVLRVLEVIGDDLRGRSAAGVA
ncbi:MAG: hypothetical protein NTW19_21015 [Planctomycetota bacterium]|nr:hypothetical protein [Planctomycetota bacterium]